MFFRENKVTLFNKPRNVPGNDRKCFYKCLTPNNGKNPEMITKLIRI